ncbi:hypothetical protein LJC43_08065, partial [Parabacteroides sp. OttesenSCG-928-G21]|nr:hypothetical protein [Parabacteroides sp. OttesenSCG-928-G21]
QIIFEKLLQQLLKDPYLLVDVLQQLLKDPYLLVGVLQQLLKDLFTKKFLKIIAKLMNNQPFQLFVVCLLSNKTPFFILKNIDR